MNDERLQHYDRAVAAIERAAAATSRGLQGLSRPDADTGEQWDAGQIWAHVTEMVPYWTRQAQAVIAATEGGNGPIPFGRTKADPDRIAKIEATRHEQLESMLAILRPAITRLREVIATAEPSAWAAVGLHPLRGPITVDRIIDEFVIAHLNEHAAELELIAAGSAPTP